MSTVSNPLANNGIGSSYWGAFEGAASNQLTVNGNSIDTGRYLIEVKGNDVVVKDKLTNTSFRAWGDPHLHTGDGDKAQFHENLTVDLQDGTKLTFKTTPKDANGIALIDSLAVMKGDQAVVASGINTGKIQVGPVTQNAAAVDAQWPDGTVLQAGREADDLRFAADGKEITGGDSTQRWGEHLLDGKGGASQFNGVGAAGPSISIPPGLSVDSMLMLLSVALGDKLQKKAEELRGKIERFNSGDKSITEQQISMDMAELQKLQQFISQVQQMASNISKTTHEDRMTIARNMA